MIERRAFRSAFLTFALAAALAAPLGAQTTQRSMYVSVLDTAGAPVPGLGPSDFLVREDGVAREVLAVAPAEEPMQIEVIVDNSAASERYITDLRRAVPAFLAALVGPNAAGRRNEVGFVTAGDRPTIANRSTVDAAELKKSAERLFAVNGSGAYLMDAIVEVCKGFRSRNAARPVIIAITTEGPEFSNRHFDDVIDPLRETGAQFHAVVIGPNVTDATDEAQNRSIVFDRGTKSTGGRFEHLLSGMALEGLLQQIAKELLSQYRVTFSRPQSLIPPDATTVSATKPGMAARGTLAREAGRP